MSDKTPVRRGKTPRKRPTEWGTAVIMLVAAGLAYASNHKVGALLSAAGACLPAILTAIASWWEARHATTRAEVPATRG